MTAVLLTGFAPFAGALTNPSWDAVEALSRRGVDGLAVAWLPCSYDAAARLLMAEIERRRPDVVVCTGVAAGRAAVTLERVAVNLDEAALPDNSGEVRVEARIEPTGPTAYLSTLAVGDLVARLTGAGIGASVSRSAGGFVCNHVFYRLMHRLATGSPGIRGGFVHVPLAAETAASDDARPSLPLETIADALAIVVAAVR